MNHQEYIDIIRLSRAEHVGSKTFFDLTKLYGNAHQAILMLPELAKKGGRLDKIVIPSIEDIEKELALSAKIGARIITYLDDDYPVELHQIPDLPPVITVKGNIELLGKKKVAIVGARNCSINGRNFAYNLAHDLAEEGIIVVSGLARGIDSAAHSGSLDHGTIAVIAGGIDNIYPPENKDLYHKIAENGLIIAESPFGSNPMAQHFPKRNRIIAGISQAVAIIEAAFGSGSLITARMAMEYNKEIFAMPGFPMDPRSKGTNNLIKQGANVLLSAADIIDAYGYEQEVREDIGYLFREPVNHILKNNNYDEAQISDIRVEIQKLLSNHPVGIEEIAVATGYDVVFILTILLELELAGKIQRYNDNKISLIYN